MADSIDLSNVTEEEPVSAVRKAQNLGQYIAILQRSWEQDVALGVTVAATDAPKVVSRFRTAATELGMGVSVAIRPEDENGNARVVVQAKEKRAYTPKKKGGRGKK